MTGYLEIWKAAGAELVALEGDRITVGAADSNDVALAGDRTVSRLHAVFERYPAGWCVRDLASRNGTFVNGERIWAERPLHPGDEILLGKTRLVYRTGEPGAGIQTEAAQGPPDMTRRERDVIAELCRPLASGTVFSEPASIKEIAERLVVTEAAVRQHLIRLYDKFGIDQASERRRVQLANEALRRGAVNLAELRDRAPKSQ